MNVSQHVPGTRGGRHAAKVEHWLEDREGWLFFHLVERALEARYKFGLIGPNNASGAS
jgi:hypothetical protein